MIQDELISPYVLIRGFDILYSQRNDYSLYEMRLDRGRWLVGPDLCVERVPSDLYGSLQLAEQLAHIQVAMLPFTTDQ